MDTAYNKGYATTIIVDNGTTAMTGHQETPGTGYTIKSEAANKIDYAELVKAVGIKHIRKVDPYNLAETTKVVKEEVERDAASVIITENSPCMLLRRAKPLERFKNPYLKIDERLCRGCKACLEIGCPAISWLDAAGATEDGRKRKGTVFINKGQCVGCEVCSQICKFGAIKPGA